jgi:hypothetical protein
MTIKEVIAAKATSGKFWLSIIAGVVFAYCSFKKILTSEAISAIVTMVFMAYFNRKSDTNGANPKS